MARRPKEHDRIVIDTVIPVMGDDGRYLTIQPGEMGEVIDIEVDGSMLIQLKRRHQELRNRNNQIVVSSGKPIDSVIRI